MLGVKKVRENVSRRLYNRGKWVERGGKRRREGARWARKWNKVNSIASFIHPSGGRGKKTNEKIRWGMIYVRTINARVIRRYFHPRFCTSTSQSRAIPEAGVVSLL